MESEDDLAMEKLKETFAKVTELLKDTPMLERETVLKFLSGGCSFPSLNFDFIKESAK